MITNTLAPIDHTIDGLTLELAADGTLGIYGHFTAKMSTAGLATVELTPDQVVALQTLFTMPRVATTIEHAAAARYATTEADREDERAAEAARLAQRRR